MECCTNQKFKRLTWGLASLCQAPRPPRLRALTRGGDLSESPGVVQVGLRRPGAGPSPAPAPAPRSARRAAPPAPLAPRRQGSPAWTAHPSVRPRVPRPWCGTPQRGADSLGAGAEGPRAVAEAGRRRRTAGWRSRRGGRGAELGQPPPPHERCAPRPGSHASHVRPLGAAAPRRRPAE